MSWGPWIDHDGTHRPVAKGAYVHVVGDYVDGTVVEKKFIIRKDAYAWYWFNYGKEFPNGTVARILRYRVWQTVTRRAVRISQARPVDA